MNVLRTVMCRIGRHSGQWSLPGARCERVRICTACGTSDEQARHTWGEFAYVDADRCEQLRHCQRCGTTESWTVHEWDPWRYVNWEYNSPQFRTCRRCHEKERTVYTTR
jgi:hypothetical protein